MTMDIQNIPRDIRALKALTKAERYKLFRQLHVDGVSDELETKFLNANKESQAAHLLALLNSWDIEEEHYQVQHVTLPQRSGGGHKKNEKRMKKFSQKVEDSLNYLHHTHSKVEMVHLRGHGVILIGQRQEASPQGFFPGNIPGFFARMGPPPDSQQAKPATETKSELCDEERNKFYAMCNRAYNIVALTDDEEVLDKNLNEFLDIALRGDNAEVTQKFLNEIIRLKDEHSITTHDPNEECHLDKMFEKMRVSLERRTQLSTN